MTVSLKLYIKVSIFKELSSTNKEMKNWDFAENYNIPVPKHFDAKSILKGSLDSMYKLVI